jgi:hypothetical protein
MSAEELDKSGRPISYLAVSLSAAFGPSRLGAEGVVVGKKSFPRYRLSGRGVAPTWERG